MFIRAIDLSRSALLVLSFRASAKRQPKQPQNLQQGKQSPPYLRRCFKLSLFGNRTEKARKRNSSKMQSAVPLLTLMRHPRSETIINPPVISNEICWIQKNCMEKQEQAVDVIDKVLVFKEYSSLELSTRDKFINKIRQLGYDSKDIEWVASEKIHGSNFSVHFNGEFARYGRRTDFLTKEIPVPCENPGPYFNESFYDARTLVTKFHNSLGLVYDNIKKFDPKLLRFSIYGEYFGGNWPQDHPHQVKTGKAAVQKGIYYTPHHEFYAFDIFVVNEEHAYWVDVLDIPRLLGEHIPAVPVYVKGTFEEVFNVNTEIDSTIPELLGLPKLPDNISEGMVIRPNKNLSTPLKERVIIKKKNKEFMEKASQPNPAKKEAKAKVKDPEVAQHLEELAKYVNTNRVASVVSKYPDLKDRNKLRELVSEDVLKDAEKDEIKLPGSQEKVKEVLKELNTVILKEINSYFIKH